MLYVSLQANGGRHRASLKGTQIDCLLAVSAPFWWSPKIKTSFFISGCKKAAKQSSMVFLPLHKYFSSASFQHHSLHTVQNQKLFGCWLVLRMNVFAYLIIDSYLVTSSVEINVRSPNTTEYVSHSILWHVELCIWPWFGNVNLHSYWPISDTDAFKDKVCYGRLILIACKGARRFRLVIIAFAWCLPSVTHDRSGLSVGFQVHVFSDFSIR